MSDCLAPSRRGPPSLPPTEQAWSFGGSILVADLHLIYTIFTPGSILVADLHLIYTIFTPGSILVADCRLFIRFTPSESRFRSMA
jgi:hypothetical protein